MSAAEDRRTARANITVERVMREAPDLRDVRRTTALLLTELPRPRRSVTVLVLLTTTEVALGVGVAVTARVIVDEALAGRPVPWWAVAVAVALTLASWLVVRGRRVVQERLIHAARERGVARVADVLTRAPWIDLAAVPMAALRELVMTDVEFAYRFLVDAVAQLAVIGLWLLATTALLLWLSPPLLVLLAGLAVATVLVVRDGARRHLALTGERFLRLAELSQAARDVVEVERVLLGRQFGVRHLLQRGFADAHAAFVRANLDQQQVAATLRASVLSTNSLSFVLVTVAGGVFIADGRFGAGALVAVLFVMQQLLTAVSQLSEYAYRAAETAKAGRRLAPWWTAGEDDLSPGGAVPTGRGADPTGGADGATAPVGAVRATGVGFGYPDQPRVLRDVDVELRRGRPASLTGATGTGKTTLALLLTGILSPDEGSVEVDGGRAPSALAPGRVLYVGSRPTLVGGSIRDNLLLDGPLPAGWDDQRLARLLALVGEGHLDLDGDLVGPNGTGVSSGQSQVIALLRALVREPDVIVLDEATSSLDMPSERRLQEALLSWCEQRVCLVISHRQCPWTEHAVDRVVIDP